MRCYCCGSVVAPGAGGADPPPDGDGARSYLVDFRSLSIVVERTAHAAVDGRFQRVIDVCAECTATSPMLVSHCLLLIWRQGRSVAAAAAAADDGGAASLALPRLSPRLSPRVRLRVQQLQQLGSPRQNMRRRLTV